MSMGFTIASRKFFGLKDGETLNEFIAEVRALTDKDREEMAPLIAKEIGVEEVSPNLTVKP